ncbi:MAG: tRNA dihydrouridine(20/20a) synthase DusA [Alphaproteobacteria bacterium]|nr:tRNA dihydrouridine(20/20a) synthase DusA [Alphaproteobacteria bacterium]
MHNSADIPPHRFSVAPMMDWTDRHCRFFHRLLSAHALLYTEMVTTGAILHGPRDRLLAFDPAEHPVALQLGGSEPDDLAASARIGADAGYDEINLNCGCPSERVQKGAFGACLMREPALVADCVTAMRSAVDIPVTVKCRLGVDDDDEEQRLFQFVEQVSAAGCETFIIHARKAWLKGLSPKANRDIPPLNYPLVAKLKRERPDLTIILNGGLASLAASSAAVTDLAVDGAMLGRAAYQNPWDLAEADPTFFEAGPNFDDPHAVIEALLPYIEGELSKGERLHAIARHILGLFQGRPGARAYRRHISENSPREGAGPEVIRDAAARVPKGATRRDAA